VRGGRGGLGRGGVRGAGVASRQPCGIAWWSPRLGLRRHCERGATLSADRCERYGRQCAGSGDHEVDVAELHGSRELGRRYSGEVLRSARGCVEVKRTAAGRECELDGVSSVDGSADGG